MSKTTLVTIVQKIGYDAANDGAKTLIQLPNGQQYYVWTYWYDNEAIPRVGSAVKLSYSEYNDYSINELYKLTNAGIGKEVSIMKFTKAN
ncbi:hypothetical protein [Chamaesiphon minutus]|uniref:Uncharacterized protein n=1 Tax=Chamaesiphon minutus (strain ATCC 27169 / PCC 6605) TaxID=1173020 RepID=K9UEB3_CHAP6|nr:hypothetical protein [Chamaesiphon minutus]AFY92544.1 hypothetical protein Cha6605_1358 [Chamaesiphon minutus PCC 6605]